MKKIIGLLSSFTLLTAGVTPLMAMMPSSSNNIYTCENININFNKKEFFIKQQILEDEILFNCELNLTEKLNINSLKELKENFNGFYFKNFNMYLSVFDKELNQDTYIVKALKPNEYYNYISLLDKNENNSNLKFYKYKPNRNYEVEIIYNLCFVKKNNNFYLNMLFRMEGFTNNNNKIKLFINPEETINFVKNI
ncbi:hypothetical protein M1771_05555 [Spiroplasma citri]|uniref:hypothetical protein n=1 Tax=Spiroplasma citri TaxID=2133 RepID=UPI0024123E12|nr:hypothetical protein [Spiroplasma citri]WFG99456.1 hypothetical protein M1771_05555 [Spiroplasma citri]